MTKRYILNDKEEALYRSSLRKISPSKTGEDYWEGRWGEGETFSVMQLYQLKVMGFDPATVDRLDVIASGQPGRIYITAPWGLSFREVIYFHRRLPCPIIGRKGDRVHVITPSGQRRFVYPNGEISRPRNRRAA